MPDVVITDSTSISRAVVFGENDAVRGIAAVAVHPSKRYFAVGEKVCGASLQVTCVG